MKRKWCMFLDDTRDPEYVDPDGSREWVVLRNSAEALSYIAEHGLPEYASLDHNLGTLADGTTDDTISFLKRLAEAIDVHTQIPFQYGVHSPNPVGAMNIYAFMWSWGRCTKKEEK